MEGAGAADRVGVTVPGPPPRPWVPVGVTVPGPPPCSGSLSGHGPRPPSLHAGFLLGSWSHAPPRPGSLSGSQSRAPLPARWVPVGVMVPGPPPRPWVLVRLLVLCPASLLGPHPAPTPLTGCSGSPAPAQPAHPPPPRGSAPAPAPSMARGSPGSAELGSRGGARAGSRGSPLLSGRSAVGPPRPCPRHWRGRGAAAGVLGLFSAGRREGQRLGLGVPVPTPCSAECPLFPASSWKPGPHQDQGSRRKGRATRPRTQLVLRPMWEGQILMGDLGAQRGGFWRQSQGGGAEAFRLEAEGVLLAENSPSSRGRQEGAGARPQRQADAACGLCRGSMRPGRPSEAAPWCSRRLPWDTRGLGKVVRPYVLPGGVTGLLRLKGLDQGIRVLKHPDCSGLRMAGGWGSRDPRPSEDQNS